MAETSLIRRLASVPWLFDLLRWTLEGGYRGHHRVIAEHLSGECRVLDLGCGTGIYARLFQPNRYVGVDISPEYIAAAQAKFPDHRFLVQNAAQLPLEIGEFDACMISGVLHHLDDSIVDRVLREAARVLRPGGRLVVWEDIPSRQRWNVVGHVIHRFDLGDHIRSVAHYRRLIERCFTITHDESMRSGAMDYQVFIGLAACRNNQVAPSTP